MVLHTYTYLLPYFINRIPNKVVNRVYKWNSIHRAKLCNQEKKGDHKTNRLCIYYIDTKFRVQFQSDRTDGHWEFQPGHSDTSRLWHPSLFRWQIQFNSSPNILILFVLSVKRWRLKNVHNTRCSPVWTSTQALYGTDGMSISHQQETPAFLKYLMWHDSQTAFAV